MVAVSLLGSPSTTVLSLSTLVHIHPFVHTHTHTVTGKDFGKQLHEMTVGNLTIIACTHAPTCIRWRTHSLNHPYQPTHPHDRMNARAHRATGKGFVKKVRKMTVGNL